MADDEFGSLGLDLNLDFSNLGDLKKDIRSECAKFKFDRLENDAADSEWDSEDLKILPWHLQQINIVNAIGALSSNINAVI